MSGGYMRKWLFVDLSTGATSETDFDENFKQRYLGGYGIGARVLYDRVKRHADPLGPDNILGLLTGPLTGTPTITGNRFMAVGKSPLTGTWGDANCGGWFGPAMKFAGFDGVFFSGIASEPVYLLLRDGKAELKSAEHVWGKNAMEAEAELRVELGKGAEIACIGTAGERMSRIACISNQFGRVAGRCGLGAVMGSKRLKAVAVQGSQKVPLADPVRATALRKQYLTQSGGAYEFLATQGSSAFVGWNLSCGDSPVKNWGGAQPIDFPDYAPINGPAVVERQQRKWGCWRCPISCGGHMKPYPDQRVLVSHKPEYETLIAMGSLCGINDLDSIIVANDLCNDYGIDTISVGGVAAFAIECFENGLLTEADTEGLALRWGDGPALVELVDRIGKREGIGEVLADGVRIAAEAIGRGSEQFAIHIRGQEPGMHDPKYAPGMSLGHWMDAAPGRHTPVTEGLMPQLDPSILPAADKYDHGSDVLAANRRWLLSYYHAWSSLGVCMYGYLSYPAPFIPEFTQAVTGWEVGLEELVSSGERIGVVRHVFNLRDGLSPLDFKLPGRFIGKPPLEQGEVAGVTIDAETAGEALLRALNWDTQTTKPSDKRLGELGLSDLARDLANL